MLHNLKKYRTGILNAFAAMIVYGAWAVYANFEHGAHAWQMAGTVQGIYAFISTLTVTVIAQWMYTKCGFGAFGILMGFCASFSVMLAFPLSIHSLVGTPDILQTILPGLVWGSGYLISFLLLKEKKVKAKYHRDLSNQP